MALGLPCAPGLYSYVVPSELGNESAGAGWPSSGCFDIVVLGKGVFGPTALGNCHHRHQFQSTPRPGIGTIRDAGPLHVIANEIAAQHF